MILTLKRSEESELGRINELILASELVSTGGRMNQSAFEDVYSISASSLLSNLSYSVYEEDSLVGFFMIIMEDMEPELMYFYIEQSRLHKGYGKHLWKFMNGICREYGIGELNVRCGKYVTDFYLKMGAKKVGEEESKVNRGVMIDILQYKIERGIQNENRTQSTIQSRLESLY